MSKSIAWDDIKREYLAGVKTKDICEKYNLNYNTLSKRITQNKWKKEKDDIISKIGEKVSNIEAEVIQKMREQERAHTDVMIKAILERLILDGKINPLLNSQEISNLVNAYEKIQRIKYKSFGIADRHEHEHSTPTTIKFEFETD